MRCNTAYILIKLESPFRCHATEIVPPQFAEKLCSMPMQMQILRYMPSLIIQS